ncbi:MAG: hypothetical protein ACWIPH_01770 [Ostreibacterium sp.]
MILKEYQIEKEFIEKLESLKYTYGQDIGNCVALKQNFREKFETLNKVNLTDSEFARLHNKIVNADEPTILRRIKPKISRSEY